MSNEQYVKEMGRLNESIKGRYLDLEHQQAIILLEICSDIKKIKHLLSQL